MHELLNFVGSQWSAALEDVVQAIQAEGIMTPKITIGVLVEIRDFLECQWKAGLATVQASFCRSQLMSARVPKDALKALGFSFNEEVIPLDCRFRGPVYAHTWKLGVGEACINVC
ncbi:MAG: hypothetical protein U0905_13895 [Pirellulales bacterium]